MSLLWIEGFETFGTTNGNDMVALRGKYVTDGTLGNLLVDDGRTAGGKCCKITNGSRFFTTPDFTASQTVVIGFGFKCFGTYAGTLSIVTLFDGATEHASLQVNASGEFIVRGRGTTVLATTSGAVISAGTWGYVELKMTIGNAGVGSYELRVNGVTVASDADEDTQNGGNASVNKVRFNAGGSGTSYAFDDIYILNTSGSDNNTFLGSRKVVAVYPSAEGDQIAFSPSTGSDNSALVDENPPNDDTDYVESGTSGHQDLYQVGDVTFSVINGVQINARCKETDANPFSIKLVAKSDVTVDEGSAMNVGSTSYVTKARVLEHDPDTTALWTDSGVDAAQIGFEVG